MGSELTLFKQSAVNRIELLKANSVIVVVENN